MTKAPPKIYIVDDDTSFRTAMGDLLVACGFSVVSCESATQLLEMSLGNERACILLDVRMADLTGPQLQDRLAELGCRLPIVFISGHGDIPTTVRTIKAGAEDFLTKPVEKERLLAAMERALVRHREMRAQEGELADQRMRLSRLTPREHEVLAMLVRGKLHKQIAHELGTAERTVKLHRHNLMQKFEVRSLAELAVIAERLGLLLPPRPGKGRRFHADPEQIPVVNLVRRFAPLAQHDFLRNRL